MDALLQTMGLTSAEMVQFVALGLILLVGLVVLRVIFRMTAALFRVGCFAALLLLAAVLALSMFG